MDAFNQQEFNNFVIENNVIGFFETPITLKSGRVSNWYVNWRTPTTDALLLEKIAQFVIAFTKKHGLTPTCFYGVPEGATKLGVITQYIWAKKSGNTKLPMGRGKPKEHGAVKDRFFVGQPEGDVIVLEDVTTTGGSLLTTLKSLKEANINVIAAFGLTNRNEKRDDGTSVKEAVEELGVQYFSLSNASDLLPELIKQTSPDTSIVESVKRYFQRYGTELLRVEGSHVQLSPEELIAKQKVCLPLDGLYSLEDIKARIQELSPVVGMFKIGKELFTRFGPEVVKLVQNYGSNMFLDLKYHDIPNTVKGAANAAAQLGVYMFNVHASGGLEMMQAAVQGAREGAAESGNPVPKVIAVTVLTSLNQDNLHQHGITGTVESHVLQLAQLARQAGLDGIVCSAADVAGIKHHLPDDFMFITPGVKGPRTPAGNDQKRVATPGNAVKDGSTLLVIGRAITAAEDKVQAAKEVLQDIVNATSTPTFPTQ